MANLEFTEAEKNLLSTKLQHYLKKEFELDLGQFDSEFLLDFISEEFGAYYYNLGLRDAREVVEGSIANISDAIYDSEKPTEFAR